MAISDVSGGRTTGRAADVIEKLIFTLYGLDPRRGIYKAMKIESVRRSLSKPSGEEKTKLYVWREHRWVN